MGTARTSGRSVFLVEDEVMIRMMVADMLEELGYSVVAEAGDIGEALKLAQSADFDLAILDVNVNGKVISPVADVLAARDRPVIHRAVQFLDLLGVPRGQAGEDQHAQHRDCPIEGARRQEDGPRRARRWVLQNAARGAHELRAGLLR